MMMKILDLKSRVKTTKSNQYEIIIKLYLQIYYFKEFP